MNSSAQAASQASIHAASVAFSLPTALVESSKIRAAFAKSIPGTTKFIIAQRISSVQDADRIIVLDGGRVNGFDTHEKLVETNEIYREIYESQVKGGGDFDVQSAGKEEA